MVKDLIIKIILHAVKYRWKSSADLKVLISTNRYFDQKSWINTITSTRYAKRTKYWEIVYCKNRLIFISIFMMQIFVFCSVWIFSV